MQTIRHPRSTRLGCVLTSLGFLVAMPGCQAPAAPSGGPGDAAAAVVDLLLPDTATPVDLGMPAADLAIDPNACTPPAPKGSLYATADTLLGDTKLSSMCRYRGQVLLIFNAAELCGYTFETAGLQDLQTTYGAQGFQVLGFYSNDFGNQGGNPAQCNAKFHVTFDTFEIAPVSGANPRPVYAWLLSQPNPGPAKEIAPQWNFSKYLISRDGRLVQHWPHDETPDTPEIAAAIKAEIARPK